MIEIPQQHIAVAVPGVDTPDIFTAGLEPTRWWHKTWSVLNALKRVRSRSPTNFPSGANTDTLATSSKCCVENRAMRKRGFSGQLQT